MNISSAPSSSCNSNKISDVSKYRLDVNFYLIPPNGVLKLECFEQYAIERYKVLKVISDINQRIPTPFTDDWKNAIIDELKSLGLKDWAKLISNSSDNKTEQDIKMRKKDHISHFTLRFAFCLTEERRTWFITHETYLFKMRFMSLSLEHIRTFIHDYGFNLNTATNDEKKSLENNLIESNYSLTKEKLEKVDIYKIKFSFVPDLVRSRRVYIKSGIAYITSFELISYLILIFKNNIRKGLLLTADKLFLFNNDTRIIDVISLIDRENEEKPIQLNFNEGSLKTEEIDNLAYSIFPPCMRAMHQQLRTTHHLKHGGRLEYGLFLKSLGLTIDDAIRFWREEFTKTMDVNKFNKEHVYTLRHLYGLEGKRVNKNPYGCNKLIETNLAAGDRHGCPFKHYGQDALRNLLKSWNTSNYTINEIVNLASKRNYQYACAVYFEASQGVKANSIISHPNLYFEEARKVKEEKIAGSKPQVPKTLVKMMPNTSIKNEIENEDQMLMDIDINDDML